MIFFNFYFLFFFSSIFPEIFKLTKISSIFCHFEKSFSQFRLICHQQRNSIFATRIRLQLAATTWVHSPWKRRRWNKIQWAPRKSKRKWTKRLETIRYYQCTWTNTLRRVLWLQRMHHFHSVNHFADAPVGCCSTSPCWTAIESPLIAKLTLFLINRSLNHLSPIDWMPATVPVPSSHRKYIVTITQLTIVPTREFKWFFFSVFFSFFSRFTPSLFYWIRLMCLHRRGYCAAKTTRNSFKCLDAVTHCDECWWKFHCDGLRENNRVIGIGRMRGARCWSKWGKWIKLGDGQSGGFAGEVGHWGEFDFEARHSYPGRYVRVEQLSSTMIQWPWV